MDKFDSSTSVSIAIFVARETLDTLQRTIHAAFKAAPANSTIDVLINGNANLAILVHDWLECEIGIEGNIKINVWQISLADKANAWNQHIHHIWREDSLAFYIDGYVRVHQDAIRSLIYTMKTMPDSLAGTGVPTVGKSAAKLRNLLLTQGGMHGNLCCVRGSALSAFRRRQIRLPLGIYRTDATIGAMLCFGLDPQMFPWNPRKYIAVDQNASWETDEKQWWRYGDMKATIKRTIRQVRGQIENQAVKGHLAIMKLPPEKFSPTVSKLISKWIEDFPEDSNKFIRSNIFYRRATNEILLERDWSQAELPPILL